MAGLDFKRVALAGDNRSARVAFRIALDHPDSIERVAALDIVPTHHILTNMSLG